MSFGKQSKRFTYTEQPAPMTAGSPRINDDINFCFDQTPAKPISRGQPHSQRRRYTNNFHRAPHSQDDPPLQSEPPQLPQTGYSSQAFIRN